METRGDHLSADGDRRRCQRLLDARLEGSSTRAAHELTHMWWGDWSPWPGGTDLWLNESFATFVGYKVVADLNARMGHVRDFVRTLARPFSLDALVSTHPISFEVKNAKQATERLRRHHYWKGAGVVRIDRGFPGASPFHGVRSYLNRVS